MSDNKSSGKDKYSLNPVQYSLEDGKKKPSEKDLHPGCTIAAIIVGVLLFPVKVIYIDKAVSLESLAAFGGIAFIVAIIAMGVIIGNKLSK